MLYDTYEISNESRMIFEADLDTGFFNSDGFDERIYRDNYIRLRNHSSNSLTTHIETIDLTVDENPLYEATEIPSIVQSSTHNDDNFHNDVLGSEQNDVLGNEPLNMNDIPHSSRGSNSNNRRGSNRGNNRRGNNRGGNRRGSNRGNRRGSRISGNGGNNRIPRSQDQQNIDSINNDDNWNVLLPEHNMEDHIRVTRSKKKR
jgi:hypothetical protein